MGAVFIPSTMGANHVDIIILQVEVEESHMDHTG